ncbi:g2835 [Coccomyxa elongata]
MGLHFTNLRCCHVTLEAGRLHPRGKKRSATLSSRERPGSACANEPRPWPLRTLLLRLLGHVQLQHRGALLCGAVQDRAESAGRSAGSPEPVTGGAPAAPAPPAAAPPPALPFAAIGSSPGRNRVGRGWGGSCGGGAGRCLHRCKTPVNTLQSFIDWEDLLSDDETDAGSSGCMI